jgi:hypothetical protein
MEMRNRKYMFNKEACTEDAFRNFVSSFSQLLDDNKRYTDLDVYHSNRRCYICKFFNNVLSQHHNKHLLG